MNDTKTAICVLGMHRSGASSITKGIHEIGAYIGAYSTLVPPDIENPRGFWEHQKIVNLHDEALQGMGLNWATATHVSESWLNEASARHVRDQLRDVVMQEFAEQDLWVWKDPRTCLFVPMWQSILTSLNITTKYVIVIRNPLDVAQSLLRRNGFSRQKSFALWLNYTLSSLRTTHGETRVVVEYDDYMKDWESSLQQIASALNMTWPKDNDALQARMKAFINPALQHSRSNPDEAIQTIEMSLVRELYGLCRKAIQDPGLLQDDEFIATIDRMDREYKFMFAMFSSHLDGFTMECSYHGTQNGKAQVQGPIDDEFHEYIIEMPSAVGNQVSIFPTTFPGMFEISELAIQERSTDGTYDEVYTLTPAKLAQLPSTALSMRFPDGGLKFLNLSGQAQFNIPYSFTERGDYALRVVMKVYRQDHPVYVNVVRQALPVYDAQVRRGTSA